MIGYSSDNCICRRPSWTQETHGVGWLSFWCSTRFTWKKYSIWRRKGCTVLVCWFFGFQLTLRQIKGTVFFFRKSSPLTHSLIFWEFFFSPFLGKKKFFFFFFFLGKVCKPLTRQKSGCPQIKVKKEVFQIFEVFFFHKNSENILFFFPGKVYTSPDPLIFSEGEKKKNSTEKKKTPIFTHSLDFCRKVVKNELFQGNKKIRYL